MSLGYSMNRLSPMRTTRAVTTVTSQRQGPPPTTPGLAQRSTSVRHRPVIAARPAARVTSMQGLGDARPQSIDIGQLARRDPLMAYSTVMASEVIKRIAKKPAARRAEILRREFNRTQPGLGDAIVRKTRELMAQGKTPNQAVFDAIRLSVANLIADRVGDEPMQGLGSTAKDVLCTVWAGTAVGGGIYAAASTDPTGSKMIQDSASAAGTISGCNDEALRQQAKIAEANARSAEAAAAAAAAAGKDGGNNTMLYVALGGGGLLLLLGAVVLMK